MASDSVAQWSCAQVAQWLDGFVDADVLRSQQIDGQALLELDRDDLEDDFGITDAQTVDVILANIDNLRQWQRRTEFLDYQAATTPVTHQDPRWTTLGPLYCGGVVLMGNDDHNGDPDELGREDCSGGWMLGITSTGKELFRGKDMQLSNDIGRDHSIVVDPEMRWVYTSENGSNSIRKWNYDGKALQVLQGVHGPMAVDPSTHFVWVLVQTGCILTGTLRVYSSHDYRWRLVKELDMAGSDITYDATSRTMWVVGRDVFQVSCVDYSKTATHAFAAWNPLSLSVDDPDGEVDGYFGCGWAVEGATYGSGCPRLVQYELDGNQQREWKAAADEAFPTRVVVDSEKQGAWVVYSKPAADAIRFVDKDGEFHDNFAAAEYFDGHRIDNILLDGAGKLWVVTYDTTKGKDVRLHIMDPDTERVTWTVGLPDRCTIAWMCCLSSTESFEADLKELPLLPVNPRVAPKTTIVRPSMSFSTPAKQSRPLLQEGDASPAKRRGILAHYTEDDDDLLSQAVSRLQNNIGGLPLTEKQLRALFDHYDVDKNCSLSKREITAIYKSFDSYGLDDGKQMSEIISKFDMMGDGTVSYDEFAILMLKLAQR
eukprot:NODE_473_length_1897_cov_4.087571_g466_i0.p1 GENE.NODE_473_length_1897_cov_4.087571_g466_i0~~NODE_473_length_1897_cov_4.087571_g466_i0.p1  ORF type:complete len:598 (-),score=95.89 NODE_473_length_1897_cov_4.087571_g466_i0:39-1832(-)